MSVAAILGAGPLGAAIAHKLADRARVREVKIIDASANVAAGKALDISQSGPIESFDTRLSSSGDLLAATGASVIVVADAVDDGEWEGDRGLAMMRQIVRAGATAPFVFAGPKQLWLMEACHRELQVPANRLIGTAPSAMVGVVRALAGLELNLSSVEVTVAGRPPGLVVGWSAATAGGSLVSDRVPPHTLLRLSQTMKSLWPPGPQAIAAPTALVVEALIYGSRRLHPALTVLEGELGARGTAKMLPLELGRGRVLARVLPSLSPQERTELG